MSTAEVRIPPPAETVSPERVGRALDHVRSGAAPGLDETHALLGARNQELDELLTLASALRDSGASARGDASGRAITYSRKVFIPLTTLCRDRCRYCVFVDTPGGLRAQGRQAYLTPEEVLSIARDGAALGCKEALFTLGDRPEDRWDVSAGWLSAHGYSSTLDYVAAMAELVLRETGLLPHLNPGVMTWPEMQRLRRVAPSMGMMLETTSTALWTEQSGAHHGSPDKDPAVRLRVLDDAGRSRIPFTTGILLGIGESLRDRAESLLAIRRSHDLWGHIQEVIVQNFRAKPRTAMQATPDLATDQYIAAVATARIVMGPEAHVQAPPNLTDPQELDLLVRAGIDDWGGVSPLTPDHVNPERPWPHIDDLSRLTSASGHTLRERLTAHPAWIQDADHWIDPSLHAAVEALGDGTGFARSGNEPVEPRSGSGMRSRPAPAVEPEAQRLLRLAEADPAGLADAGYAAMLGFEGEALERLAALADEIRRDRIGDTLTYAVNRNVNSALYDPQQRRGGLTDHDLRLTAAEAAQAGATELCVQGPLHEELAGEAYLELIDVLRTAAPGLHLHAYRPAEIRDASARLGVPPSEVHALLKEHGVGSVPGTAARILDDGIRRLLSAGTDEPVETWLALIRSAHRCGLRSTATMVYGHIESGADVVAHLRRISALQDETGGFTEFIPMPLVPQDSPVLPRGVSVSSNGSARIASRRYSRAVHAVSRLMLTGRIDHVQAAWTKLGLSGAEEVLRGGADDLGGILLDGAVRPDADPESGRSLTLEDVRRLAGALGRAAQQRTTLYRTVPAEQSVRAIPSRAAARSASSR